MGKPGPCKKELSLTVVQMLNYPKDLLSTQTIPVFVLGMAVMWEGHPLTDPTTLSGASVSHFPVPRLQVKGTRDMAKLASTASGTINTSRQASIGQLCPGKG